MSIKVKEVKNGRGTNLIIKEDESYIEMGKNGERVMIRADGKVFGFNTFEDLVNAIDESKAVYVNYDSCNDF